MIKSRHPIDVQNRVRDWKRQGTVALVPTMGCLHSGHLKLIEAGKKIASRVIVSLFVNPLQFGPGEDFEKYPRAFENDAAQAKSAGADLIFHPEVVDLYPAGFATTVSVAGLTTHLCGKSRPGHFAGVTTVCLKLFQISLADFAVFGEKDFQQLRALEQMRTDLNLALKIVRQPIVREADGLALSSRNRYLSAQERTWALNIPQSLNLATAQVQSQPEIRVGKLKQLVVKQLTTEPLQLEYVEVASERDLVPQLDNQPVHEIAEPRLLVAVRAGGTRLIDNVSLRPSALSRSD